MKAIKFSEAEGRVYWGRFGRVTDPMLGHYRKRNSGDELAWRTITRRRLRQNGRNVGKRIASLRRKRI
jgi:hypothetical protein